MKDFFKSKTFKVIVALVVVCCGIMIGNAAGGRGMSFPGSIINVITAPFQTLSAMLKNGVGGIGDYFKNQQQLIDENALQREQIALLREQLAEYEQAMLDNEAYREMLDIKELRPDFEMVGATVISRGSGEYHSTFTINKGSNSGIRPQDAVVTPEGIVGVISEVGYNYAKVTTILSPNTNIGGYDTGSHSFGILTTTAQLSSQGYFMLSYLPPDSLVTVGKTVITSGQGSAYPPNLVAGVIQRVTTDDQGVTQNAILIPAADIQNLKSVLVITDFDPEAAESSSQQSVPSDETPE